MTVQRLYFSYLPPELKGELVKFMDRTTLTQFAIENVGELVTPDTQTKILKFVSEHIMFAAGNGFFSQVNLRVLKWARENGCDWDKEDCLRLGMSTHEIRAWIRIFF